MAAPIDSTRAVCLIGLRCSGKTSVGAELARRWGWEFSDLDDEVLALARERDEFASVGAVLDRLGLEAFRALEVDALVQALSRSGPRVLATGGGVVEHESNRALLDGLTCVWLRAAPAVLRARMRADPAARPTLTGADPLAEIEVLQRRREPWYRALATVVIDTDTQPPSAVSASVAAALEHAQRAEP